MVLRVTIAALLTVVIGTPASRAGSASEVEKNWPQWRGPSGNGVAPHGDPPVEWSEQKNVKWKVTMPGLGHATPVVWGNRIFVLTAVPMEKEGDAKAAKAASGKLPGWMNKRGRSTSKIHRFVVTCLDRDDGRTLWERTVREEMPHESSHKDGSWATASPCTDGERVYAFFGSRGLHCLDMNGNIKWQRDFGKMATKMSFGEGISPALYRDRIIINWDHKGEDFVAALHTKTGNDVWRKKRDEFTSWSTPLVIEHRGKPQVIVSATNKVRGYGITDGRVIWECGGLTHNVVPHPVHADGIVYVMSGFRGAAFLAIDLAKAKGDVTNTESVVWKLDKNTPYCPSPLLYDGYLYMMKVNLGILTCLDVKQKKIAYGPQRLEGMNGIYTSPVGAAGRVYLTGRRGLTYVIKPGPEFEVLAKNKLDDRFTASPVVVGKDLLLRGHRSLYCISK
jgi:outer membrane protein assembly factor BamB